MVRFFSFSAYHGKNPVAGSTHIRVNQLIKYWPEADVYRYGENPEVLIFQKVYITQDYKFPVNFPGIKILDVCDPDWLDGAMTVRATTDAMDAVVVPSENLASFFRQIADKPVWVIKDRFDMDFVPKPREHSGQARSVVWFGYSHNAELLKPAIASIERLGLKLIIISNDDPIAYRWGLPGLKEHYTFVKYKEDTIYEELQKADFALLPEGYRPVDHFKSDNKTTKAILAGLPVAHDIDTMLLYMDGAERQAVIDKTYESVKEEYNVKKSVEEYKSLIKLIYETKSK